MDARDLCGTGADSGPALLYTHPCAGDIIVRMSDPLYTSPIPAEVTIHRIGGSSHMSGAPWERRWTCTFSLAPGDCQFAVRGVNFPDQDLGLIFRNMTAASRDWIGAQVGLESGLDGSVIGQSLVPTMIYASPWDIPTWTRVRDPYYGHFTIGIRVTGAIRED